MHKSSFEGMARALGDVSLAETGRVLDLGSMNVNGTYRPLFGDGWEYVGVDMADGDGVDAVMRAEYAMPENIGELDLLISGQCIEHVRNPFRLVAAACDLLKPGGIAVIVAPHRQRIHRYPIDCWRYNPDGMRAVLEEAGLRDVQTWLYDTGESIADCWGMGWRP